MPAVYFLGEQAGLEDGRKLADKRVSLRDPEIAMRASIPVPSQGEVLDRWLSLAPGETITSFVDSLQQDRYDSMVQAARDVTSRQGNSTKASSRLTARKAAAQLPSVRVRIQARWVPIWACQRVGRAKSADVRFPGIQISILDHVPRELLLLSLMKLRAQGSAFFDGRIAAGVTLQDFQLDN